MLWLLPFCLPYKSWMPFSLQMRSFTFEGRPKKGPRSVSEDIDWMVCIATFISSVTTIFFCCWATFTALADDVAALSSIAFFIAFAILLLALGAGRVSSFWFMPSRARTSRRFLPRGVDVCPPPKDWHIFEFSCTFPWDSICKLGRSWNDSSFKQSARSESVNPSTVAFAPVFIGVCFRFVFLLLCPVHISSCGLMYCSASSSLAMKEESPRILS